VQDQPVVNVVGLLDKIRAVLIARVVFHIVLGQFAPLDLDGYRVRTGLRPPGFSVLPLAAPYSVRGNGESVSISFCCGISMVDEIEGEGSLIRTLCRAIWNLS
jgi:hypothetical protein